MLDQIVLLIETIMTSPWLYPVVVLLTIGDALFPLLPAEVVITLSGAWSGSQGVPHMGWIFTLAVFGAMVGDNACFFLGRRLISVIRDVPPKSKRAQALRWVTHNAMLRPGFTIIVARFIPWARWILTISLGSMRYPWLKFFFYDTIGILIWAGQATVAGMIGGRLFSDWPLLGVIIGLALGSTTGWLIDKAQSYYLERRQERSASSTA